MNSILKIISISISLLITACQTNEHHLIIRHAKIFDGTGAEPYKGDIAVSGGKIVMIGNLQDQNGIKEIDAEGLSVAPGFIDLHSHLESILQLPRAENKVRQGITTALGGPDGFSPWPLGNLLDTLERTGIGINVAFTIGHNTIRNNIMGMENRAPTIDELVLMKNQVEQAMKEGAYGISTGLKYLPGAFATTNEVIELSKVAAHTGGIYTTHMRDEGLGILESVRESIVIGREANIPVLISHHKIVGKPMWGASKYTLKMVDSARALGLDIVLDQYPYNASYTQIKILIPAWAMAGGEEEFKRRTQDPILYDSIKHGIEFNLLNDRGGGSLRRIQFSSVEWNKALEAKTLHDWIAMQQMDTTLENGAKMVIQAQLNGGAWCIFFAMHEEDIKRIMRHPQCMIASDSPIAIPGEGHAHPRFYGTYPRVLGYYARDLGVISLEEAIRKMTSLPAERLGLRDRGQIEVGNYADLVIFDSNTIKDNATFTTPDVYPEGIKYVFINGEPVLENDVLKEVKPGMVLRKGYSLY